MTLNQSSEFFFEAIGLNGGVEILKIKEWEMFLEVRIPGFG